ncbi:D-aminoacyl-tRNA deacylase [Caniella muris]|uniref:D-aminoacyl-tRNA deacylase n=1 Tax=Caniella muris TaxID=2941502 RepID=UPI00203FD49E|nr:D-aminoacyl-tRNA deacylase [Caniella muris]
MRALLQRVTEASVTVDGEVTGACGPGLCILLGVGPDDDGPVTTRLWEKIRHLRIFDDEQGHMNRSLLDVGGGVLIVSQFTLYADARRGRRPSFTGAADPGKARELYERFCEVAAEDVPVGTGIFAADMQVALVNDGPVTLWLDTDELF